MASTAARMPLTGIENNASFAAPKPAPTKGRATTKRSEATRLPQWAELQGIVATHIADEAARGRALALIVELSGGAVDLPAVAPPAPPASSSSSSFAIFEDAAASSAPAVTVPMSVDDEDAAAEEQAARTAVRRSTRRASLVGGLPPALSAADIALTDVNGKRTRGSKKAAITVPSPAPSAPVPEVPRRYTARIVMFRFSVLPFGVSAPARPRARRSCPAPRRRACARTAAATVSAAAMASMPCC